MKTNQLFERLWEHGRTLRRVGLVLVMCIMAIPELWAWATNVYLNGNFTGDNWSGSSAYSSTYQFTLQYNSTDGKFYIPVYATGSDQYFRLWTNNHCGPATNNTEIDAGDDGCAASSYDEHNWKYVGDAGIISICIDQTGGKDWNPWVWVERPDIYIRHKWNNSSLSNQKMTDNRDGTYQYIGKFSSSSKTTYIGPCSSCSSDNVYFKKWTSPTMVGSPTNGDRCIFEYNASGYKGVGNSTSNTGTITITKLYSITYDGNGKNSGSVPSAVTDKKWNESTTIADNTGTLAKTGYVFAGWNTAADGTGTYYAPGSTFTPSAASTTLYAQWLTVHTPGLYETAAGSGGYGQSLVESDDLQYEVYQYAISSSKVYVYAGTSTTSTSAANYMLHYATSGGNALRNWMLHSGGIYGNSDNSTHTKEFQQNAKQLNINDSYKHVIAVSGFDQFSIYAKDKKVSSQQVEIYINGSKVTAGSSTSLTVRRYNLTPETTYIIRIEAIGSGSNASNDLGFSLRVPSVVCGATQPGTISKGTLSACSLPLTAAGSAASNNTWYWQESSTGTDKTGTSGATKNVTSTGTYYVRSYYSAGNCWSDAESYTVTASDLTPAAPSALAKSSVTAKGVTLTVTDAANTNDYEFYVNTSSSAPSSGTSASYTSTSKSVTITDKYAGTTFYAWARAKCGSNKSAWTALGDGGTFTTSTVSAAYHLTNVSKTSGAESGIGGSTFTAVFSANTDYSMPTPVVTIGGNAATSGTDYTWTEGTGTLTIAKEKITGNIDITLNSVPSAPSSAVISGTYHYFPGDNISLTCTPTGNNGPTTYQWYKGGKADGNAIDGATSATYTKNSCAFADAGSYYCKVTCNATSIWANTNSYENYDVKILRLYVNGSKSGEPYGNVDFTKVDGTTATASIALGSGWTYGFNIADGCGHYYGNSGTMTENNCTNWTTNVNGTDCGLTTTNAATYIFTINYSSLEAIVTSVTYPVGNQAADKVIYFDNSGRNWSGSSIYYRIGHSSHSQASQLSLVSGTANLYKMTTTEYNGFSGWHIANATGDVGSGKSIYKTVDGTPITEATAHEGGAVTQEAITVTPTTSKGYGADVGVNNNCEFFNYTITSGMKTDNVAISPYSNGTITVNYTNTSGSAATLTSGNADLAHSVILTSITAVADEGYDASAITINGGAYSANYVVTGNTTIAASFTLKTYTISYNKGTNGTGSKASETKTHGVNFTLPGSTFTYGGHAQDGWSTSDGGALAYALSGSYTTNAAQEFFPHWKCNTPTITDNGDNTVSITVPSGTTVRYTTDGTDPSSSTGTVYSTTFSIAADCTVKAIAYQSNCTDSEIASQACDYTAPANFQMIANSSAGSDATLANNESISQGSKNCATLTGGTAVYSNADGDSKSMKVAKPNNSGQQYGWYFNANKDVITITMSAHIIKAGSIISVTGYAASNNGVYINEYDYFKNGTGAEGNFTTTYTVLNTDTELLGKNVLTLSKNGSTKLYSITISNCQSATPCTTPTLPSLSNQAGCSYSAWNATPSNASTISAAGESISYSWKKGATEKATTASYTPDANGTDYTVTVTVSKAGKISTSVTSSALSATKYAATSISTQPTTAVNAIEGENFTLGTGMVAVGQGTKTYQWYSYTTSGGAGEASIGSATSATYTTSKAVTGTYYYKVKVTADCGTATSNMITVTVSEPPCFSATNLVKNGDWSDVAVDGSIDAAKVVGTITGGTIKNTGSAALGSNSKSANAGLVMDGSSKQVTVTLSGSNHLTVGSVITLTAAVSDGAKSGTSKTSGLVVSGYDCSPVNKASETAYDSFTQSYTVTEESSLVEANSFTIALKSGLDKTYLHAITVTGCEDCTPINPTLTAGTTTLYSYPAPTSTTLTLDKNGSTGGVTWSSSNEEIATVSGSGTTATVTAVASGTATISATIASDGTHCAKTVSETFTVTGGCGDVVIAEAVLTSKTAAALTGATLLASNMSNSSAPYKLDKTLPSYFGLRLSSGSFQVGDSIIFKVKIGDMDINNGTTYPVAVFASTSTDDKEDAIYISGSNTKGTDNVYIRFAVTSSMLTALNTNKQVLILRNTNIKQNHSMYSVQVKRHLCPEGVYEFTDATGDGKWSTAGNWIDDEGVAESLPTISDRVIISKPVTVDDDDAVASEVILDQKSPNTGKLTIDAGNALIIAGTLKKTTTGTSVVVTAAADVIINSTRAAGTGALVMGSHDGTNAATVNFETKVKYDNGYVNQYLGSPFSDETPYVDYEIQLYKFVPQGNGSHGWWNKLSYGDEMVPFMGYNQLSNNTSGNYLNLNGRTGHLNASSNVEFTIANGKMYYNSSWPENMFANSWTAPIHIDQFEDGDFTNVKKVIYIFNAGTPAQYNEAYGGENSLGNDSGDEDNEAAGTYTVIPVKSAAELSALGAVTTVIPAMQAFSVMATSSSPSLTLNFNRLVYTPALTSVDIEPTRAPKREQTETRPDAMRLRVRGENGWTTNAYILGREDFTEGYDDGWDGEYMEGDGSAPQLYSATEEGYFVVNCVPEIEGTLMAFHPGSADNAYTFSFVYKGTETWYLNDLKEQQSTLISNETSYPFVSVAGDKAARFVISKTPINKIVTGIDETNGEKDAKVRKLLIDDHIYIIRGGKMYTADGALVK